jgi:hypothetical protein
MGKIYGYFEYEDSLTPGRSEDGGLSQLLFDSEGKLSDHASFHPEDPEDDDGYSPDSTSPTEDTDSAVDAAAGALLALAVMGAAAGGYILIRKATPHVQRMVNERALSAVRSFWNKVRGQGSEADWPDTDETSIVVVQTSPEHEDAAAPGADLTGEKAQMSPDEWYARFRAIFEARKFTAEQWTLLSSVKVMNEEAIEELQREMARNRPEDVVRQVVLMLEASSEIDADSEAEPMPDKVKRHTGQRP